MSGMFLDSDIAVGCDATSLDSLRGFGLWFERAIEVPVGRCYTAQVPVNS